jgi:hypothetical protein
MVIMLMVLAAKLERAGAPSVLLRTRICGFYELTDLLRSAC